MSIPLVLDSAFFHRNAKSVPLEFSHRVANLGTCNASVWRFPCARCLGSACPALVHPLQGTQGSVDDTFPRLHGRLFVCRIRSVLARSWTWRRQKIGRNPVTICCRLSILLRAP